MINNFEINNDRFDESRNIVEWLSDIAERSIYEGVTVAAKQFLISCATTLIFHGINWALHRSGIFPSWIRLNRFVTYCLYMYLYIWIYLSFVGGV